MSACTVTTEQIRKALEAQPFLPFVLHLADGREVPLRSREFVTGGSGGRTLTVHQPRGRRNVIDLLLVTDLEFESGTRHEASEPAPS
jgi:hypothetical protein